MPFPPVAPKLVGVLEYGRHIDGRNMGMRHVNRIELSFSLKNSDVGVRLKTSSCIGDKMQDNTECKNSLNI